MKLNHSTKVLLRIKKDRTTSHQTSTTFWRIFPNLDSPTSFSCEYDVQKLNCELHCGKPFNEQFIMSRKSNMVVCYWHLTYVNCRPWRTLKFNRKMTSFWRNSFSHNPYRSTLVWILSKCFWLQYVVTFMFSVSRIYFLF